MALRAPTPLPAAGRGTTSRCPRIGFPHLVSPCMSWPCFVVLIAVAASCHRRCHFARPAQTPAKETYNFLLSSHFPCLASWIVCAPARPLLTTAACDPPPRHCSSSPPSPPPSPLSRFLCSLPKVHRTRSSCRAPASRTALPPAHAHPHPALANHSSLVLPPRPAAARHDPHAPAARCAATNAPPPGYAPLPCALLATMHQASKT